MPPSAAQASAPVPDTTGPPAAASASPLSGTSTIEVLRRPVEPGQFRARAFHRELAATGLVGSMGRVASAGDNAAMKLFFSLLQKNVLNRHTWKTRDDFRVEIIIWIEHTYNRRRRQRRLGKLAPIEYELVHHNPQT